MSSLWAFLWGFGGSLAVEVVAIHQYYSDGRRLPKRYSTVGFWVSRVMMGVVAGGLAVANGAQSPQSAVYIGAAAPLILQAVARGLRPPDASPLPLGGGEPRPGP